MNTFDEFTASVRDHLDDLAEGWQHLWQRTQRAVTQYSPLNAASEDDNEDTAPARLSEASHRLKPNRWGLLTAEVIEHDDSLEVRLEAPGMTSKDFTLSVSSSGLTIGGEKRHEERHDHDTYHLMERAYGRFERHIPLPVPVRDQDARASYRDGVLTVTLPKAETGTQRRIIID